MLPRTIRKIIIVAGLTLAVAGCFGREQQVYNVVDHPIPPTSKRLTLADVQKTITLAGVDRGWVFTPIEPGHLKGHVVDGQHSADVDVRFTTTAYSISYLSSSNLMATPDGEIHRSYNHWIHNLEMDIERSLIKANAQ